MMKFIFSLSLILSGFLMVSPLSAQIFNAGIGGGLNIAQVEGDGFSGYNKAGASFGLFVNTFSRENVAIQMEMNYSSKGSQVRTTIEDPRYYRIDLRYIEIPVFLRYFTAMGLIAEAGLSGGYLFYSREEDELGELPQADTHPFRKTEFAAHGGIGWLFTENITVNARISYSLIPVRDHAGGGKYYFNRGQNNNVISFIVQYLF